MLVWSILIWRLKFTQLNVVNSSANGLAHTTF